MCYIYHACSATSNLQAQSCVDLMLVSSSGLADVKATTGVSLKNLKIDGIDAAAAMVVSACLHHATSAETLLGLTSILHLFLCSLLQIQPFVSVPN